MNLNNLLLWLSARNEGSWAQFRAAVEELHVTDAEVHTEDADDQAGRPSGFPVYRQAQFSLSTLCHVEFLADDAWRVVPPVFAVTASEAGKSVAVLCGARTPAVLQRVHLSAAVEVDVTRSPDVPDRVRLIAEGSAAIYELASSAGICVQDETPMALLLATPTVCDAVRRERPMPRTPGWDVHKFSYRNLAWEESTQKEALKATFGLFRFSQSFQRFYFLTMNGITSDVSVHVGKYVVLRAHKRRIIEYSEKTQILRIPRSCRPPLLTERALNLCSGLLPSYGMGFLEYQNVSPRVAKLAAHSLCQGS